MHFDDRLATVLRTRAESGTMARIQFRQLIDLVGSLGSEVQSHQIDAAYQRLGELSAKIRAEERAGILGDPGLRLRNTRLIAALAQGEAQVASAALAKAELRKEEWLDLMPALPLHARALVRQRRDLGPEVETAMARLGIRERALPPAAAPTSDAASPASLAAPTLEQAPALPENPDPRSLAPEPAHLPLPPLDEAGGIRALVKRIEDFRKTRRSPEDQPGPDSPRLPLGDAEHAGETPPRAFDFTTDAEGRIVGAAPAMAPMATGLRLGGFAGESAAAAPALTDALRRRQPVRGEWAALVGAPALAGRWRIDMTPRFDPLGGRFTGYAGRMRRPAQREDVPQPLTREAAEGDRIRQLLHELRTPVNAIQGFAEVIQQQLFGPTPHEYRALAASIVGDAARILAGFDELERLAKLDSGAMQLEAGTCDLGAVLQATLSHLEPFTGQRGIAMRLRLKDDPLPVAVAPGEGGRPAPRGRSRGGPPPPMLRS